MALSGQLKLLYGPAYVASSATDIYNLSSALIYTVIKHIHLFNTDTSARTVSLYVGATGGSAGGTELFKTLSIPPNSSYDFYSPGIKLVSTNFLSGLASSASTITITIFGEQVVV